MTETTTGAAAPAQTRGFQAEVKQLLQLMIHSLYSHPEIFLRELISNAADAIDKLKFEALEHPEYYEREPDLRIAVAYDREARTITVRDNGIGMSFDEVIANIGTIAKSGTREFFASLSGDQAKDARLIGQFGVGFYSSFIVADRVTLVTRRAGLPPSDGVRWESTGEGEYTIEHVERAERGTEVTLHLRARSRGASRSLSPRRDHPQVLRPHRGAHRDAQGSVGRGEEGLPDHRRRRDDQPGERAVGAAEERHHRGAVRGVLQARRARRRGAARVDCTRRIEGRTEYTLLLYVPSVAPFDLWDREHRHGVKLYVRRVFIMDDAEQLLPPYLRFVRGIVDSNDLPLNVSREILQESRDVEAIRNGCVKRVLDLLDDLAQNDKEKYATFWKTFGTVLKEGFVDDMGNRDRLAKLVRFASTKAAPTRRT